MFSWTQKHSITPIVVSDADTVKACRRFVDDHRVLVEPACGAALAPIYDKRAELNDVDSVLVIVCGGIGISLKILNWGIFDFFYE